MQVKSKVLCSSVAQHQLGHIAGFKILQSAKGCAGGAPQCLGTAIAHAQTCQDIHLGSASCLPGSQVWLKQPLVNLTDIQERHNIVDALVDDPLLRERLRNLHLRGTAPPPAQLFNAWSFMHLKSALKWSVMCS